jgi:hypothetical protein
MAVSFPGDFFAGNQGRRGKKKPEAISVASGPGCPLPGNHDSGTTIPRMRAGGQEAIFIRNDAGDIFLIWC